MGADKGPGVGLIVTETTLELSTVLFLHRGKDRCSGLNTNTLNPVNSNTLPSTSITHTGSQESIWAIPVFTVTKSLTPSPPPPLNSQSSHFPSHCSVLRHVIQRCDCLGLHRLSHDKPLDSLLHNLSNTGMRKTGREGEREEKSFLFTDAWMLIFFKKKRYLWEYSRDLCHVNATFKHLFVVFAMVITLPCLERDKATLCSAAVAKMKV